MLQYHVILPLLILVIQAERENLKLPQDPSVTLLPYSSIVIKMPRLVY